MPVNVNTNSLAIVNTLFIIAFVGAKISKVNEKECAHKKTHPCTLFFYERISNNHCRAAYGDHQHGIALAYGFIIDVYADYGVCPKTACALLHFLH